MPKHRRRLSPDTRKLISLLISAIEPIAKLITVVSNIH
jgi:hypothetical protein